MPNGKADGVTKSSGSTTVVAVLRQCVWKYDLVRQTVARHYCRTTAKSLQLYYMLKLYDQTKVEEILRLSRHGLSASKIRLKLTLPIGTRQVQRLIADHRGPVPKDSGRQHMDEFGSGAFRSIVEQLMVARGLDPHVCGICKVRQLRKCDIHHLKYDGATIEDVIFACRSCNLAREQKGLV